MLGLAIKPILEALVMADQLYLRTHHVPPIYESGVRYKEEPMNRAVLGALGGAASSTYRIEEFAAIPAIIERGWGDCDDVSPWRCAELRENGEHAKIRVQWKKNPESGQKLFHIVVRRADGRIEDPSLLLGMR
jgi:hypothetical protein